VKVWELNLHVVVTKEHPDIWEHWATFYVVAETMDVAIQKLIEDQKKDFFKVRVEEGKLLCEVDLE
jgi:hypothetical protein